MISTLSRGPWVGTAALCAAFVATGPHALKNMSLLGLALFVLVAVLLLVPGGSALIDFLPFVGTIEAENVTYRGSLIEASLAVIQRNLWLGSIDYLEAPELVALAQSGGLIDIVNTYIQIALETGLIGLTLFVLFFCAVLAGLRRGLKALPNRDSDLYRLGRVLFATLIGVLVTIGTVSSISYIPVLYWSLAGMASNSRSTSSAGTRGPVILASGAAPGRRASAQTMPIT